MQLALHLNLLFGLAQCLHWIGVFFDEMHVAGENKGLKGSSTFFFQNFESLKIFKNLN